MEKYNNFVQIIKNRVSADTEVTAINTICSATKIRQEETEELSKKVQCMIIIGGKNSSCFYYISNNETVATLEVFNSATLAPVIIIIWVLCWDLVLCLLCLLMLLLGGRRR